jgi:hypothetical protein
MDDPSYFKAVKMSKKPKMSDLKTRPDFRIHNGSYWYYFKQKQVRNGNLFLWYATDLFFFLDNASEMHVNLTSGELQFRHGHMQKWTKGADKCMAHGRTMGLKIRAEYIARIDDILLGRKKK